MTVLFGTLGFHAKKLLGAIPGTPGHLERVVVYTAWETEEARKRSTAALETVGRTLDTMGIEMEHREFGSPWNLCDMLEVLIHDLSREKTSDVIFNLTGGPKTMTVAVTLACLFMGVRAIYVPEEEEDRGPMELPLFRIPYSSVLTEGQIKVLRAVEELRPNSLQTLAMRLRLKGPTITFHVQNLERMGALILETDPRDRTLRIPRLTDAGRIMLTAETTLAQKKRKG
jgi:CRISPR locus-related DNA-binding protein